jgi:hypothetical protein
MVDQKLPSISIDVSKYMPARIVGGMRRSTKGRRPIFSHRPTPTTTDVPNTNKSKKVKSNPAISMAQNDTPLIQKTNPESVEAAEQNKCSPRSVATDILQNNCYSDDVEHHRRLPKYAYPLLEQITHQSRNHQMKWCCVHMQIIFLTVFTIAAAVFYGRYYPGYPDMHDLVGLGLWMVTILLPLYIAGLVHMRKQLGPVDPFRKMAAMLESQIFLFRFGVAPFEDMEICQTSFRNSAQSIWNSTHLSQQFLLPEEFWNDEKLETNMPTLEEPNEDLSQKDDLAVHREWPFPPQPRHDWVDLEVATEPSEMSPMFQKDNRSALSEEDYRIYRLEHTIASKTTRIQTLEFRVNALQRSIQLLTMGATGTALVSMQWIIPIILALAAAGGSVLEVSSYQHSIRTEKAAVEKLEKILDRWEQNLELPKILALEVESAILESSS